MCTHQFNKPSLNKLKIRQIHCPVRTYRPRYSPQSEESTLACKHYLFKLSCTAAASSKYLSRLYVEYSISTKASNSSDGFYEDGRSSLAQFYNV